MISCNKERWRKSKALLVGLNGHGRRGGGGALQDSKTISLRNSWMQKPLLRYTPDTTLGTPAQDQEPRHEEQNTCSRHTPFVKLLQSCKSHFLGEKISDPYVVKQELGIQNPPPKKTPKTCSQISKRE